MPIPQRSGGQGRAVRSTRQRRALSDLLAETYDFRSAQDLHAALRERGAGVGLATVYRNLAQLVAAGEVDVVMREDGESLYRRCEATHHHHLVCRSCGATVEVAGPAVESWADAIARAHGYTAVSHTLELFGLCRECGRAAAG